MAIRTGRRDLGWIVLIAISFVFGLAVSWQRWGNPLVDCGREMNQPLRLSHGEMLYSDVRHIYGPLSPYVNSALYSVFGPSLNVLYADGIVTGALILSLIYWISRRLMGPTASAAAALSVTWLCAFKQAGNYVLPYSYSALHGCALGLMSLAFLLAVAGEAQGAVRDFSDSSATANERGRINKYYMVAAGFFAGLTVLAKTEMGVAAAIAGVVAALLMGYTNWRRSASLVAVFLAPAVGIVIGVYGFIAGRVGLGVLLDDSFLFFRNVPPELVYFNKRMSGLDQPLLSLAQVGGAALKIATLAILIALVSLLLTRRKQPHAKVNTALRDVSLNESGRAGYPPVWILLSVLLISFLLVLTVGRFGWDQGPYLAMPILLIAMLVAGLIEFQKQFAYHGRASTRTVILLIISVYALANLARVILRVRSGGAYSSYLLPASIIIFTYWWAYTFARLFRDPRARRMARTIAVALLILDSVGTAGLLGYRYRARNTHALVTDRGVMMTQPDIGKSFDETIQFIRTETLPGEPIAVMPEGTSLNFFTDHPNPLREEITTPGFLDALGEERTIARLTESSTRVILIANRATLEFGATVFGRDYCRRLMGWIEENYERHAVFGPDRNPEIQIGDKVFFIRAYIKRTKV